MIGSRVFTARAEVLASLNHPNIAAIYGLEDVNGVSLVEFVEGEDLAQRIGRGRVRYRWIEKPSRPASSQLLTGASPGSPNRCFAAAISSPSRSRPQSQWPCI